MNFRNFNNINDYSANDLQNINITCIKNDEAREEKYLKDLKDYENENDIVVSNIENNNLKNNINIIIKGGIDKELENLEIENINNINEGKRGKDKYCQNKAYLSSEETNLLNNSKYDR